MRKRARRSRDGSNRRYVRAFRPVHEPRVVAASLRASERATPTAGPAPLSLRHDDRRSALALAQSAAGGVRTVREGPVSIQLGAAMTKKKGLDLARVKTATPPGPRPAIVEVQPAALTDEDVRTGLEALVKALGKDRARLFLEAVAHGRLRGETFVERIVRRNPVAAVVTAGVAGAVLGALFGPPQLPPPPPAAPLDEP